MSLKISTHPVEEPQAPPAPEAGGEPEEASPPAATGGQEEQCCPQPLNLARSARAEGPSSFEDDTVLPLKPIAEGDKPAEEEGKVPGQAPSEPARRGKLSPEEKVQRKREAQHRYYMKKKAQAGAQPPEGQDDEPAPKASAKPKAGKSAPKSSPPKAPPQDIIEDLDQPLTPPHTPPTVDDDDAPRPQTAPVDLRLTPHLRSRALLRRDYENRSSRYANLFAGVLPA